MKTLNLVDLNTSDIKYKISKFPDGQQNILIDLTSFHDVSLYGKGFVNDKVQIKSRLNNWLDLELTTCAVASLRELGVEEIHLYTPYIMGARSDRKFEDGNYKLYDQVTRDEQQNHTDLDVVFKDGILVKDITLTEIRNRINEDNI